MNDVGKQAAHFSHIAVVGDFNYPKIKWDTVSASSSTSPEANFIECIRDLFLTQHVTQPTRSRGSDIPSVLDLVLTNEPGMVSDLTINPPLDGSDHSVLLFDLRCYVKYAQPTNKFSYDKGNYDAIRDYLQHCTWDPGGDTTDVNTLWEKFAGNITAARDKHIPTYTPSSKPSWRKPGAYTPDTATRQLIRDKARKHNLFMEHRNRPDAEVYKKEYTRSRNHVRTVLRKKKRNYERDIAAHAKDSPKKFFAYCSNKTRTRSGIAPLLQDPSDKSSTVFSDADKSEVLQQQYCGVFTEEGPGDLPDFAQRCDHDMPPITISVDKVRKKLKALNISKSAGPDGIHPRLLVECADILAEPLAFLYQASIDTGVVPAAWKESVVSPIFKKGARCLASNYRPVSLTAILCKLMEDIIRESTMEHLLRHKLLSDRQFGFIKGRSTTLQLLTYLEEVTERLAQGGSMGAVDAIYLDYQKAFDTVPHRRLIHKLRAYGIVGSTLAWIESFLSGRTQRVAVNGVLSGERVVLSGVPQGSVLGPLLFLLYINDILDDLETSLLLFADDSKLFNHIRAQEDMDALQRDLSRLEAWSGLWLLRFHPDKCHVLSFGKEDAMSKLQLFHGQYSLCGHLLDHVEEEKDLGVIVDSQLNFASHIDAKVAKAMAFLGLIRRNFQYLNVHSLLSLYKAFVRPHLEYAQSVWSPSSTAMITKIENMQKRAFNLVPELRGLSYPEQLQRTKLPTLAYRRLRGDLIEVFKHIKQYDKHAITSSFSTTTRNRIRQTAHKSPLHARFFYHMVQELWNGLPANCRDPDISIDAFKNRVDKHWILMQLPLLSDPLAGPPTRLNPSNNFFGAANIGR